MNETGFLRIALTGILYLNLLKKHMAKKKLIIYGTGKFAEYVQYVFNHDSEYEVVAFCIEKSLLRTEKFREKSLFDFDLITQEFPPQNASLFIAVGNNIIRERIFAKAKQKGYFLASYISSKSSHWENLQFGENVFVDEGCVLQPFITIKDNSILFTSQIGHHTQIGKSSLLSGCKTGGNVKIGNHCYIGLNASIKQNLHVADHCIIGMGCIIEKDTGLKQVYTHKGTIKREISSDLISSRFLK